MSPSLPSRGQGARPGCCQGSSTSGLLCSPLLLPSPTPRQQFRRCWMRAAAVWRCQGSCPLPCGILLAPQLRSSPRCPPGPRPAPDLLQALSLLPAEQQAELAQGSVPLPQQGAAALLQLLQPLREEMGTHHCLGSPCQPCRARQALPRGGVRAGCPSAPRPGRLQLSQPQHRSWSPVWRCCWVTCSGLCSCSAGSLDSMISRAPSQPLTSCVVPAKQAGVGGRWHQHGHSHPGSVQSCKLCLLLLPEPRAVLGSPGLCWSSPGTSCPAARGVVSQTTSFSSSSPPPNLAPEPSRLAPQDLRASAGTEGHGSAVPCRAALHPLI